MARLFTSGFELNSTAANVEWSAVAGSPTIQTTIVRSGTYAMQIGNLASATRQGLRYQFSSANSNGPFYFRTYFRVDVLPVANNSILECLSSGPSTQLNVLLSNSGTLKVQYFDAGAVNHTVGTSSALVAGQWYRLEIFADITQAAGSQIVTARLDGVTFGNTSVATVGAGLQLFRLGGNLNAEVQTIGTWYFDDAGINDTTGSFQNSWLGAGSVIRQLPNAAGDSTQWTIAGSTPAATNWQSVNETTPDDAVSLVNSSVLNNSDFYTVGASGIPAGSTVNVVHVDGRFNNDTADATTNFQFQIEKASAGTVSKSSTITPNTTTWSTNAVSAPRTSPIILYQDPDSTNWTQSTLDTIQIGMLGGVVGVNKVQVTDVWTTVDYNPPPSEGIIYNTSVTANFSSIKTYNIGPITTTSANELLLLNQGGTANSVQIAFISGGGITWQRLGSLAYNSNSNGLSVWRCLATQALSAVTFTVTLNIVGLASGNTTISAYQGVDTSGTSGGGAIGNTAMANDAAGATTVQSVTYNTSTTNSLVVGAITAGTTSTLTPGTALIANATQAASFNTMKDIRRNSSLTKGSSVRIYTTTAATQNWGAMWIEILPLSSFTTSTSSTSTSISSTSTSISSTSSSVSSTSSSTSSTSTSSTSSSTSSTSASTSSTSISSTSISSTSSSTSKSTSTSSTSSSTSISTSSTSSSISTSSTSSSISTSSTSSSISTSSTSISASTSSTSSSTSISTSSTSSSISTSSTSTSSSTSISSTSSSISTSTSSTSSSISTSSTSTSSSISTSTSSTSSSTSSTITTISTSSSTSISSTSSSSSTSTSLSSTSSSTSLSTSTSSTSTSASTSLSTSTSSTSTSTTHSTTTSTSSTSYSTSSTSSSTSTSTTLPPDIRVKGMIKQITLR